MFPFLVFFAFLFLLPRSDVSIRLGTRTSGRERRSTFFCSRLVFPIFAAAVDYAPMVSPGRIFSKMVFFKLPPVTLSSPLLSISLPSAAGASLALKAFPSFFLRKSDFFREKGPSRRPRK